MKKDLMEIILIAVTVVFSLLTIILIIWKLFGNSPTFGEIMVGLSTALAGWLLTLTYKVGGFDGSHRQFQLSVRDSFEKVKADIMEVKTDFREMKSDLAGLKSDIRKMVKLS